VGSSGAQLFARYAYPPNELGYCGPDDASVLLRRGSLDAEQQIARHARQFEGAWPYLEIIASAAGIADPLDVRVVEAYWIGNDLLDNVDPESLVAQLQERFVGQTGASWVPGSAHHSFHVFAVYPWVGLLRRGTGTGTGTGNDVALSVLEQAGSAGARWWPCRASGRRYFLSRWGFATAYSSSARHARSLRPGRCRAAPSSGPWPSVISSRCTGTGCATC